VIHYSTKLINLRVQKENQAQVGHQGNGKMNVRIITLNTCTMPKMCEYYLPL